MTESLAARAEKILRLNDRGRHTVPSGRLYPHQWAWDSGFAAIGWAHLDVERAAAEVDSVLEGQWSDGRVPHIQFRHPNPDYFPGPDQWGYERSSTISNPPVWTLAAERLFQKGLKPDKVRSWLSGLERSHQFLFERRDPIGLGCIATSHPWENGQDNCPAWDEPLQVVDPEEAPPFSRVDVDKVDDPSQRPTEENYKRYMTLVHRFARNGFRPADFLVYDPFFTTLVILAEEALARLSREFAFSSQAQKRAKTLREGLRKVLWSEKFKRFGYFDARSQKKTFPFTVGSVAPAMVGFEVEGLAELLNCAYPVPTVAASEESFDPVCYWRGPTWVNINWLLWPVVGDELRQRTVKMVEENGFWEYFHPSTGQGLGTDRFTWTAALVLDMVVS